MKSIILMVLASIALVGCSSFLLESGGRQAVSSSLVEFLYPNKDEPQAMAESVPVLKLPLRVGLAFVPSKNWQRDGMHGAQQLELLERIKADFAKQDFISHIEVIPSDYLRGDGGFDTLDRLARMYQIDVMALVSYDQVRNSDANKASFLYWTIVGMYVIPGNDNRVQTFVDTAVFDISSRKLLFRAPGLSKLEDSSTAVKVDAEVSQQSRQGFELAVDDMVINLNSALDGFKDRVKEGEVAKIEHRPGYSGSGSPEAMLSALLVLFLSLRYWRRKRQILAA